MPDTSTVLQPAKTDRAGGRETPSIGSQLCTKCGLCCTGALHDRAVLEPEELEFASGLGLEVQPAGRPAFALPCKYLRGCSCSIYSNRPKVCARYQCQLLDDVQQANITLDAALEHVRIAKRMCDDVRALLPPGMNFPKARRLLHEPSGAVPAATPGRAADMRLRLALTTLCLYLDKHFKNSRESKLLTMTSVDQDMGSMEA